MASPPPSKKTSQREANPSPLGTAATDVAPEPVDAPPAARLKEAGAIIIAKTTMPDYGMLSSGLSSFHPLTRNPWNLQRNPGGSSAGAGAAAAAGYGPLHVGTDIGGSVRLPAGWCGVFGLKPSAGRIPIDPPYIGRVAGPMTRSVRDASLMMATLVQTRCARLHEPEARAARLASATGKAQGPQDRPPRGGGLWLEARTASARGCRARGARLRIGGRRGRALAPFLTQDNLDGLDRFWRTRSLIDLKALAPDKREKVLPFIRAWAESAEGLSGEVVFHGFNQILEMRRRAIAATLRFDYVISPTAPIPAYSAELASPSDNPLDPFPHIGFTVALNMSEQPAATINCGFTADGLPIGMQIIGRRFDDIGVLQLAMAFEEMRAGEAQPWPEP